MTMSSFRPNRHSHTHVDFDRKRPSRSRSRDRLTASSNFGHRSRSPPDTRRERERDRYRDGRNYSPPAASRHSSSRFGGGGGSSRSFPHSERSSTSRASHHPHHQRQSQPASDLHDDSYDSYRPSWEPRPPQSDFTFRVDKPSSIADSARTFEQQRGGGHRHTSYRRGGPLRRFVPSNRPILNGLGAHSQEVVLGVDEGRLKYRAIEDLSEDEEASMDLSAGSDVSTGQPPTKRARKTAQQDADDGKNTLSKWSNPDPYTALPPPDESQRKKTDLVKLIRKARLASENQNQGLTGIETGTEKVEEDFISFDMGDNHPFPLAQSSAQLPRKPSTHSDTWNSRMDSGTDPRNQSTLPPHQRRYAPQPTAVVLPPYLRKYAPRDDDPENPLGSRKRTIDDELKPPLFGLNKGPKQPSRGAIVPEWAPVDGEDDSPWSRTDSTPSSEVAVRLHKEIWDFYEYVRPRSFEQRVRRELVTTLETALRRSRTFRDAVIKPFGSFVSGLYLPTGDMDLVVCSNTFLKNGFQEMRTTKWLFKFRAFLQSNNLCVDGSVEIISKAKVPLVKYVDKSTGLRVDISFENVSGVDACDTFVAWKQQYPAMPILVTLIKHFLIMRGLNEPVSGGIGGFSVICLVVSMLQLMPQVQSNSVKPEHRLGEMLMEFLDLYGNHFDYRNVAIRMNPPGQIHKTQVRTFIYKNVDRLSIIDPNNAQNDIAGGSSNIPVVVSEFHHAFNDLQSCLADVYQRDPETGGKTDSLLRCILAGNYSSFRQQRNHLRRLHEQLYGPCSD